MAGRFAGAALCCDTALGRCSHGIVCARALPVALQVAPSPRFERHEFDLYVDAHVDFADAALGTSIE